MTQDLRSRAIRGVGWSAVQNWGSRIISFLVFPILAHLLDAEDFGLVALAGVYLAFIEVFAGASFGAAIEQRRDLDPEHLDSTFWSFLGLGIVFVTASLLLAGPVSALFKQPALVPILRWMSLRFLFLMLSGVQVSILRRHLRMRSLALRTLVASVSGGITGIVMAFAGYGVWSLVGQQLVSGATGMAVLWLASDWRPRWRWSLPHFKEMAGFGLPVMGMQMLDFLNRRSDQLLIGYYLGPAQLGYYNVPYRLLLLMTNLLTGTTSQVALPVFSKMQDDLPRLRRAFYKAVGLTLVISAPIYIGMALLAEEVTIVVFGAKWLASIPIMRILAFIGLLHSVQYFNGPVMLAVGRPTLRLALLTIHTVVNVTAFLIVVRWGIVAVAAAYVIRGYVLAPMDLMVLRRLGAVEYGRYFQACIRPLVAAVGMAVGVYLARIGLVDRLAVLPRLLVLVSLGAVLYAGLLMIVARPLVREVWELLSSLGRRGPRNGQV